MAGFFRAKSKRVTDPLDDEARARIVGDHSYASSGSEHSAAGDDDDDSPCLFDLVHGFHEEDREADSRGNDSDSDSDRVDSVSDCSDAIEEVLRSTDASNADSYRNLLLVHVSLAAERFSSLRSERGVFVRSVMGALRERGHNAAVCKTKWEASGGLTAGAYEYIDVVRSTPQNRYIVDVDFVSEFQIARPASQYARLLQSLPRIFVGRSEELKRIVRITCDAARRSLRSRDLSVPPWRKNRYVQQKWLGPYRRTTNLIPTANGFSSASAVHCRYIGFDDAASGRVFVRTR